MSRSYFEDVEVGETRKAGPYLVSKNEIIQFARQYDPQPRHIDEEAAAVAQATRLPLHHEHPERVAGLHYQGAPCFPH